MDSIDEGRGVSQETVITSFLDEGSIVPALETIAPLASLSTSLMATDLVNPFMVSVPASSIQEDHETSG